jgi:signal transduction histidine kinase
MMSKVVGADHDQTSGDMTLRRALQALAHELTVAEARERERIARDLHDEIGQTLTVARFSVQQLRRTPPAEQAGALDELDQMLAQASRAIRSATFDLSSRVLDLGLEEALVELAGRLTRSGHTLFRVEGHLPPVEWPEPARWVLYRVVRELASNVLRHAEARQAVFALAGDGRGLQITITDDGVGIATDWAERSPSREGGFGLVSAYAQMQALGGSLVVESGLGKGTRATVRLSVNGVLRP